MWVYLLCGIVDTSNKNSVRSNNNRVIKSSPCNIKLHKNRYNIDQLGVPLPINNNKNEIDITIISNFVCLRGVAW